LRDLRIVRQAAKDSLNALLKRAFAITTFYPLPSGNAYYYLTPERMAEIAGEPVGDAIVEAFFVLETSGPARLGLGRFLPSTPLRVALDRGLRDRTANFAPREGGLRDVPPALAREFLARLRPEVEEMVEAARSVAEASADRLVAEASGRAKTHFAAERARVETLVAIDDPGRPALLAAVAFARRNAFAAGVEGRVEFFAADWFGALKPGGEPFDVIVSNPPYVTHSALSELQPEIVHHEPHLALDGGPDGLKSYRAIIGAAGSHLAPGGALLLEIGSDQREAVQRIAAQAGGYDDVQCVADYAGRDRVVTLRKKGVAADQKIC
jgi:hypothetical protein